MCTHPLATGFLHPTLQPAVRPPGLGARNDNGKMSSCKSSEGEGRWFASEHPARPRNAVPRQCFRVAPGGVHELAKLSMTSNPHAVGGDGGERSRRLGRHLPSSRGSEESLARVASWCQLCAASPLHASRTHARTDTQSSGSDSSLSAPAYPDDPRSR